MRWDELGPDNEAMLGTQVQCKCSLKQEQESDHVGAASLKHVEAANLPSEKETADLKRTTKEEMARTERVYMVDDPSHRNA